MENNKKENFDIQVNMNFFATSINDLTDLFSKKSKEMESTDNQIKLDKKKYDQHLKLRESCQQLKDGFAESNREFDTSKVIKKVQKIITEHIDHLHPEANLEIFYLKDDKNRIVTILPGTDIGLVAKNMTPEEEKVLWGNLFMLYISASNVIASVNKHKREGKVWTIIPKLKDKVIEFGIVKNKLFFGNPFVGINEETGEYDVKTMFSNLESISKESGDPLNPESMLKMIGVNKMFDMKDIISKFKDIKQSDIDEATKSISKLVGAEGDADTNNLLGSLVSDVIKKVQAGGDNLNMMDIANLVAKDASKNFDASKFQKTAGYVKNFMNNSQENLKNMKDDKGNPIGEQLLKSMKIPMQLLQQMGKK